MSQYFVNTNSKDTPQAQGWGNADPYDQNRIPRIEDTKQGGFALHKMGTSIPHPFARLIVFEAAFNEVNQLDKDGLNSSYAKLVSECLDLLEFLYLYGDQVTVKRWDFSDIERLNNSPYEGHQNLAKSLTKAMANLNFRHHNNSLPLKSIFLFYYKKDTLCALLGGTSPNSLVFTSPNIRKNLKLINANGFRGLNNNELFQDYSEIKNEAVPLNKRAEEFRNFIYHLFYANQSVLNKTSIGQYISKNAATNDRVNWNQHHSMLIEDHQKEFGPEGKYAIFTHEVGENTAEVNILDGADPTGVMYMPLGYRRQAKVTGGAGNVDAGVSHDYEIRPDFTPDGETLPLVLNAAGVGGATLVNGMAMPQNMNFTNVTESDIQERILPTGQNIRYPFIYSEDLLEDQLIKLSYPINKKGFIGLECDGEYFLLPVKPLFLKYFKPERLKECVRLNKNGEGYKIVMNVPITYQNRNLEIIKEIKKDKILDLGDGLHLLGVALFPSYRVMNDEMMNMYSLMVREEEFIPEVEIYKGYTLLNNEIDKVKKETKETKNTNFYSIDSTFDAIRFTLGSASGLVVPKFVEVNDNSSKDLTVGVDFGTTNTYLCIQYKSGDEIKTLSIEKETPQVLTLNSYDLSKGNRSTEYFNSMSPGGVDVFYYDFARQFVPHILGKDASASFPFRSIAYEDNTFDKNSSLFDHLSIGFNNLNESVSLQRHSYIGNLKWLLSNGESNFEANERRVELFIFELAWLIKNAIMLGPNPTKCPKVYITFPASMNRTEKSQIVDFWTNSFDKLMGTGNVEIDKEILESTAPFLFIHKNNPTIGANSVNIDIGGGTSDILYINAQNKKMYSDSSRFAGDDLWGDGIRDTKKNPYMLEIKTLIDKGIIKLDEDEENRFKQQGRLSSKSSDLMSYIFRNQNLYNPHTYIKKNKKLFTGIFVHFAALIYNVARTVKALQMDPKHLNVTFSGLGSKYIELISKSKEDIADIIKAIFKDLGMDASTLKVSINPSPKEITAMGAVMAADSGVLATLNTYTEGIKSPQEILMDLGEIKVKDKDEAPTKKEVSRRDTEKFKEYFEFIDTLLSNKSSNFYRLASKDFGVTITQEFIENLKDMQSINGAYEYCASKSGENDDDRITETTFFWPLKQSLIGAISAE